MIPKYQKGWTPFSFTPPPIYRKIGEELATQLAQASQVASSRSNRLLEEHTGRPKWAWLLFAPFFTKYTPFLFWWFFFRNVTTLYEFRNDTCFLSVRLRDLTGRVITPFFGFRNVTEFHGLCNNASFWFPACYGTSRIVQQWVQSTSKWSNESCTPPNNGPRTKLGYDSCEESNLVLNWEKCHFMVQEGIVLGHKISKKGIEVDKAKYTPFAFFGDSFY